jgi:hypothetical protein
MRLGIVMLPNDASLAYQTHQLPKNTMSSHMKHEYIDIYTIYHTISSCITQCTPGPISNKQLTNPWL